MSNSGCKLLEKGAASTPAGVPSACNFIHKGPQLCQVEGSRQPLVPLTGVPCDEVCSKGGVSIGGIWCSH